MADALNDIFPSKKRRIASSLIYDTKPEHLACGFRVAQGDHGSAFKASEHFEATLSSMKVCGHSNEYGTNMSFVMVRVHP